MDGVCPDSMLCKCCSRAGLGCQGLGLGLSLAIGQSKQMRTIWWVRQGMPEDPYSACFLPCISL